MVDDTGQEFPDARRQQFSAELPERPVLLYGDAVRLARSFPIC